MKVDKMVICDKHKICKIPKNDPLGCGGEKPHERCDECGKCPYDKSAKCVETLDQNPLFLAYCKVTQCNRPTYGSEICRQCYQKYKTESQNNEFDQIFHSLEKLQKVPVDQVKYMNEINKSIMKEEKQFSEEDEKIRMNNDLFYKTFTI